MRTSDRTWFEVIGQPCRRRQELGVTGPMMGVSVEPITNLQEWYLRVPLGGIMGMLDMCVTSSWGDTYWIAV